MINWKMWVLLGLLCMGVQTTTEPPDVVRVAVKPMQPFVIVDGEDLSGFSVDLWRAVASQAELEFKFITVETVGDELEAVESGQAEVAISGISITEEREDVFDFSYPYFTGGLQIMIRSDPTLPLRELLETLFSPALLELLVIIVLFILIVAHLFWLVERQHDPEFPRGYLPGIFEAIWWSVVTVTTVGYGDRTPRRPFGRLIAIIWMFLGLVLVANFTAGVTSVLTVQRLEQRILTTGDLAGRRVATVTESSADEYLRERRISAQRLETVDEAFDLLRERRIDAIVYDAPVLNYYAANEGRGLVTIIGPLLESEMYGIVMPNASPLREDVNRALLAVMENGLYEQIRQTWFGADEIE